jgi:hypothetical protein
MLGGNGMNSVLKYLLSGVCVGTYGHVLSC